GGGAAGGGAALGGGRAEGSGAGGAAPSPEAAAEAAEERRALLRALMMVGDDHRQVVGCRYLLQLSVEETAATLGIPEGTVKSRLARALAHLPELMEPGPHGSAGRP